MAPFREIKLCFKKKKLLDDNLFLVITGAVLKQVITLVWKKCCHR